MKTSIPLQDYQPYEEYEEGSQHLEPQVHIEHGGEICLSKVPTGGVYKESSQWCKYYRPKVSHKSLEPIVPSHFLDGGHDCPLKHHEASCGQHAQECPHQQVAPECQGWVIMYCFLNAYQIKKEKLLPMSELTWVFEQSLSLSKLTKHVKEQSFSFVSTNWETSGPNCGDTREPDKTLVSTVDTTCKVLNQISL